MKTPQKYVEHEHRKPDTILSGRLRSRRKLRWHQAMGNIAQPIRLQ